MPKARRDTIQKSGSFKNAASDNATRQFAYASGDRAQDDRLTKVAVNSKVVDSMDLKQGRLHDADQAIESKKTQNSRKTIAAIREDLYSQCDNDASAVAVKLTELFSQFEVNTDQTTISVETIQRVLLEHFHIAMPLYEAEEVHALLDLHGTGSLTKGKVIEALTGLISKDGVVSPAEKKGGFFSNLSGLLFNGCTGCVPSAEISSCISENNISYSGYSKEWASAVRDARVLKVGQQVEARKGGHAEWHAAEIVAAAIPNTGEYQLVYKEDGLQVSYAAQGP
jgi:hypothetical protein